MATEDGQLNLGEMGRAIAQGVVLSKEVIVKLGVEPSTRVKAAMYFSPEAAAQVYEALASRLLALAADARDGMLDVPAKPKPGAVAKGGDTPPAADDNDEL